MIWWTAADGAVIQCRRWSIPSRNIFLQPFLLLEMLSKSVHWKLRAVIGATGTGTERMTPHPQALRTPLLQDVQLPL